MTKKKTQIPKVRSKVQSGDLSTPEQKVLNDVEKYGWHVLKILEEGEKPRWSFTIGLYRTFGCPEVIIFGMSPNAAQQTLNYIGEQIKDGRNFQIDEMYSDIFEERNCIFRPVKEKWYGTFLGFAEWFYQGKGFPTIQCFWPDREGRFPWDKGYEFSKVPSGCQPSLFAD